MPISNSELKKSSDEILTILKSMAIGDTLKATTNVGEHLIRRINEYEWQFLCECCKNKKFVIQKERIVNIGVLEGRGSSKKKWYEVKQD